MAGILSLIFSLALFGLPFLLGKQVFRGTLGFSILALMATAVISIIFASIIEGVLLGDFIGTLILSSAVCLIGWISIPELRLNKGLPFLFIVGVLAATLSTILKASYGGWFILGEARSGLPFTSAVFHVTLRASALLKKDKVVPAWLLLTTDILFLPTALLRWDIGDGPDWLTITALLGSGMGYPDSEPPAWLGLSYANGGVYNLTLYIPVALCWLATILWMRRSNNRTPVV